MVEYEARQEGKDMPSNATKRVAALYLKKGFIAPFPLSPGKKNPPPKGFTGNIPPVTGEQIKKTWGRIDEEDNYNLALRLQVHSKKPYDIISIDVDDYGDKHGLTHLAEVEAQEGPLDLPSVPRSSRRGATSGSGQYYFRVPKGRKWEGKVCADVEVVQLTHRYSAVWPSVVDGLQYKWYLGEEETEIPDTDDLPELPEAWVKRLARGAVTHRKRATRLSSYDRSIQWMEENFNGFNHGVSSQLKKISEGKEFLTNLSGGAHDTMLSAVHAAIRYGAEGHEGVGNALTAIHTAFSGELDSRTDETRRSKPRSLKEFEDAVVGEVSNMAAQVEEGVVVITKDLSSLVVPKDSLSGISTATQGKPVSVEWKEYRNTDYDHARMFNEYWGNEVLSTSDSNAQEFATWDKGKRRFVWRNKNETYEYFNAAVPSRLRQAAENEVRLSEDSELSDDEAKEHLENAESLQQRANRLQNTREMNSVLSQLHSVEETRIKTIDLDSKRNLVGIGDGFTLDVNKVPDEEYLRTSRAEDVLTMSTAAPLVEGQTHPAWDEFLNRILPDEELRLFTRKALGYALADGNPDKKAIFFSGPSNTGKSTILLACQAALGDYASPVQTSKVYGRRQEGPTPELIANIDKLMVTMSETGDGDTLSSNAIKQITGNDKLQLRGAHRNETINKSPRFTPYSSTNSPPKVTDADQALRGRILVIPFDHPQPTGRVSPDKDVVNNPEIWPAILAWMFEGFKDWVQDGLDQETWPEAIRQGSDLFASNTNLIEMFVSETLTYTGNRDDIIEGPHLHHMWKLWAANEGLMRDEAEVSRSGLYQKLKSNGYPIRINTKLPGKSKSVTILRGYQKA